MSFSEWKTYKLGELYDTFSGLSKSRKEFGFGNPFVTFKDVFYNYFLPVELTSLANTNEKEIKSCSVKKGDIFLTRTSETQHELGYSSVALRDYPKATFNGFTKRLRLKKEIQTEIDLFYIGYYLRSPFIRNQIGQFSSLTTRASLNSENISLLEVRLPNFTIQAKIGYILKSLDDKIELNRQTNQTLEAIAQTLFKEMCLPKGDVLEEGWRVKPLDEVGEFLNGLALQKYPATDDEPFFPVIKIRELKNGITASSDKASKLVPEKYVIKDGDLLFSWSGTLEVAFWCGGDGALNQHLFKVSSKKYPKWFLYLLVQYHISYFRRIAEDKTTTMGHIQRKHLTEAKCFIPKEFNEIDKVISPIIKSVISNEIQIQTLIKLRDSLLPKLMKGEITLTETKLNNN